MSTITKVSKPVPSNRMIFKHVFYGHDCTFLIHDDAQILDAQIQENNVCIWTLEDTFKPKKSRIFKVYGTGFIVEDNLIYIATVQQRVFAWHIFEEI
jgi:hypothetical protein